MKSRSFSSVAGAPKPNSRLRAWRLANYSDDQLEQMESVINQNQKILLKKTKKYLESSEHESKMKEAEREQKEIAKRIETEMKKGKGKKKK